MSIAISDKELAKLKDLCVKAKDMAYCPYSKFRVGACLLTKCGKYFSGCNVENISFGLSICAERTAYVKAVSEGYTSFKACAVSSDVMDSLTYPCGACRQFMSEFDDLDIFLTSDGVKHETTKLSVLLPNFFTENSLKTGRSALV